MHRENSNFLGCFLPRNPAPKAEINACSVATRSKSSQHIHISFLQVSTGEIPPFSQIKLEVVWQPTIPGKSDTEFVISFNDPDSESVSLHTLFGPSLVNQKILLCYGSFFVPLIL